MDDMSYNYNRNDSGRLMNNKLRHVNDGVKAGAYAEDIDNQQSDNYRYDKIGNLVSDKAEKIERIQWNVYGKISSIQKTGTTIEYGYDASGNRITKTVNGKKDFYVRDAQGNVLALYEYANSSLKWAEQHLYGSSRIGVVKTEVVANGLASDVYSYTLANDPVGNGIKGKRVYELSNHLGNVMATISDRKMGVDVNSDGQVDYFEAEVLSQSDYYPGGMKMKDRSYGVQGRYGFNGQEKSLEINSDGNSMTAEFWQYDARIGRRWNVDPVTKDWESPYAAFSNNPILNIDPRGNSDSTYKTPGGGTITTETSTAQTFTGGAVTVGKGKNQITVHPAKGTLRSFVATDPGFEGGSARYVAMFDTKTGAFTGYGWDKNLNSTYDDYLKAAGEDLIRNLEHANDPMWDPNLSAAEAKKNFINNSLGVAIPNVVIRPLTIATAVKKIPNITYLTKAGNYPAWNTVKTRYWNLMNKGKVPTGTAQVRMRTSGEIKEITVSKELHHINGRGGADPHRFENLKEVWPWEHAAIDASRNTGYDFIKWVK